MSMIGDDFQFTYDAQGRGLTVLSPDGHVLQRAIPTTPMAGCSSAWMAWAAVCSMSTTLPGTSGGL